MNLKPSESLTGNQVAHGLKLVIKDGLATEAMTALTGGTFLVAMALQLGASNFQIGLLAALPTLTNVFQLVAIWLVQRFNNRRVISFLASLFGRLPLIVVGLLPFLFSTGTSIQVLIFFLFFHYLFASIAGASWNSWMKDLVPEERLGTFFSQRSRLTQTMNVVLSMALALALDFVKKEYPGNELVFYSLMFICGGLLGLLGAFILSRTPEPRSHLAAENLGKLFARPLKDPNFRKLLFFNSFWSFSLNLATPFFAVFMMNTLGLPVSYIIGFGILSQFAGIAAIRVWGRYSDRYSNKTIIRIAAPVYVLCILAWSVVSIPGPASVQIVLIALINILSGMATSGINLALTNIGIKLAPKDGAIAYIALKNMTVAFISAFAPLFAGWMADFFTQHYAGNHFLQAYKWNMLFLLGGLFAIVALRSLKKVQEPGEVGKALAMSEMKVVFRKTVEEKMTRESILSLLIFPVTYPARFKNKMIRYMDKKGFAARRWNRRFNERNAA